MAFSAPVTRLLSIGLVLIFSGGIRAQEVGERVDLARFGSPIDQADTIGVEWRNPRDVHEVRVSGLADREAESLELQWWGSVWPGNGGGGWMRLDDVYNGRWVRVDTDPRPDGAGGWVFTLPPLTLEEWDIHPRPPLKEPARYRRTHKVRVAHPDGTLPSEARLAVYSRSRWDEASFDVELRCTRDGVTAGQVDVINGHLLELVSLEAPRAVRVDGSRWQARKTAGQSAGLRARLLYAANDDINSNDLTRVTVRLGDEPAATGFSFVPQDVMKAGAMRLPDFGALVAESAKGLTLANDPGPPRHYWRYPVRQRLTERPEMTRETAMAGIPRLEPARWVPLGVPSARQEVFVSPTGDWSFWGLSIGNRFPGVLKAGRDSQRIAYRKKFENHLADRFETLLDTRPEPRFDGRDREDATRHLEQERLPLIHVAWHTGPIGYQQTLIAATLVGDYGDDGSRRGDEPVALLTKLDVTNTGNTTRPACVSLRYSHNTPIQLEDDGVIAIVPPADTPVPEGLFATRGQISMDRPAGGAADGWTVRSGNNSECSEILAWRDSLEPGQSRTIYIKAPYVDLLTKEERNRLRDIRFDAQASRIRDYWRERMARGMQIEVPDPAINSFYHANLWHIVITTDRDPPTGLYNQGVATVRYGVYANETVMIARSMDMRGEHEEAERFLEPMLHFQGHEPLKGKFTTKEGAFHSAGAYTHGEYAMNHGFVLWGVADHYLMTRDRTYLQRVAPKLIEGCDFLIAQRGVNLNEADGDRSPVHGLAPPSSLEDVVEYKYWFATNGYYYLGMKRVAEALADIGHPEAARIADEAEAYRRDIEAAVRQATTRSAAVPLRDGTYIPYVPSRVFHWRHLTEGWIREALYPALHLATAEVVACDDPLITWMLDELEDNIFFSWQSGYNVETYQQTWFERGGVTLQPCLLDTPPIYMERGEIKAALRSFWNTYALLIYPDVHCFAEWAPRFGEGGGPLYKTADEARFVMWLRQLLVSEEGDRLWLGRGVPRAWLTDGRTVRAERAPTRFGQVSLTLTSELDEGVIRANVNLPPWTQTPDEVWLRLRHPAGARFASVTLNGQEADPDAVAGEDIRLWPSDAERPGSIRVEARYRSE